MKSYDLDSDDIKTLYSALQSLEQENQKTIATVEDSEIILECAAELRSIETLKNLFIGDL